MDNPKPITETQLRLIKPMMKAFTAMNVWAYNASNGRLGARFGGGDVCLIKMKGAKTGKVREIPLMYVPYKDGVILVASMAGAPKHPTWYYNLMAHPDIEVTVHGETKPLRARQATDEEKAEVWPQCCEHYQDFDLYQRRTPRNIPVFICEPRNATNPGVSDV